MNTLNKSILKTNYYYEFKDFYDTLPKTLPVIKVKEFVFTKYIKYEDILKEYDIKPCDTFEEAAIIAANAIDTLKNGEYRIVFFLDDGILCGLGVWRYGDGKLSLHVDKVCLDSEWDAGDGVLVSNEPKTLETADTLALGHSGPLQEYTEKGMIEYLKKLGYRITRTETKEVEY